MYLYETVEAKNNGNEENKRNTMSMNNRLKMHLQKAYAII